MNEEKKKKVILSVAIVVVIGGIVFYNSSKPSYNEKNSTRAYKGNADGEILIREYSDFACPACKSAEEAVKDIIETYGDQVRFEYHHFPLTSIPSHKNSFKAAVASECANEQDKFWEYHGKLFENQESHSRGELISYAEELDMNTDEFKICIDSGVKDKLVRKDISEANVAGVNGTPTFFMGEGALHKAGKIGDWRDLKNVIERDLKMRGILSPVDNATSTEE